METIEATSEPGIAASAHQPPVTPRPRRTLRAVLIRLLEAWLARLHTPCPAPVVGLLPPPIGWSAQPVQDQHDPVRAPVRSAWQWLGVIVVLVLAVAVAWGAWRRIETLEQRHEEAVSMTLAAVEQELADQRASLGTIHTQVASLVTQATVAPSPPVREVPADMSVLKQEVEALAMTIGAYGAILGQHPPA